MAGVLEKVFPASTYRQPTVRPCYYDTVSARSRIQSLAVLPKDNGSTVAAASCFVRSCPFEGDTRCTLPTDTLSIIYYYYYFRQASRTSSHCRHAEPTCKSEANLPLISVAEEKDILKTLILLVGLGTTTRHPCGPQ